MKYFQWIFILFWVGGLSFAVGSMHAWHYADFSVSKKGFDISSIVEKTEGFGVIHFLTPKCSCSNVIFDHLLSRGPLKEAKESVVVIDDESKNLQEKLQRRGFRASVFSSSELIEKFSEDIKGVPLLVIYDKDQRIHYVGGYSQNSITPLTSIDIPHFLKKVSRKKELISLPVRGCAVSMKYKKILDPLGLKYDGVKL